MGVLNVINLDALEENIRFNGFAYWYVSSGTAENRIMEYDSGKSFEENLQYTVKLLKECVEPGLYNFFGKMKEGTTRGCFNYLVRVGKIGGEPMARQEPAVRGYSDDEVNARIASAIADLEQRRKIEELERKLKEAEDENKEYQGVRDQFMAKCLPFVEPVLGAVLSKFTGGNPAPAPAAVGIMGASDEEREAMPKPSPSDASEANDLLTADEEERLYSVIQKLKAAEPEWLMLLEKIAAMAEQNDPMFGMAKNILMKKQ